MYVIRSYYVRTMRTRPKPKTPARRPLRPGAGALPRVVAPSVPDTDDEVADRQRGGVQSIGRAFAILEEVARHRDGIGLAELSKRVGLHRSTAFHLVRTMVQLRSLRQPPDSKKYRNNFV